ncbi:aminoacyl-tRNA hydrolase [Ammoniphilus sp. CFH 90114]|uniref:aminoacyl-tRNA hydrolase n=1 Tax=Ammoniphilus sp. CFH 90114 TaxID=2493665 RepID=UPI00100E4FD5|nr:aminoacyl-tRNA hydrolase [Ammoniphilus sp. CFH 90114]RXT07146.1 peptidyl-tRNA hydrolase [Ammoniphilus sp. CFH 90114]
MNPSQELVQYYVVNEDLSMSKGKIASQVAHAATIMTLHCLINREQYHNVFESWLKIGQKKVVLGAAEKQLHQLIEEGFLFIRDGGRTEVPEGSVTVVVLPPMEKAQARKFIGSLKVL